MLEYNINRILVPIDFSKGSINALDTAVAMAKRHSADILLLNVVENSGLSGMNGDCDAEEAVITMKHESTLKLQSLQYAIIERNLVPCEVITTTGIVSSAIIKTCAIYQVDLIVMGTHGSSGFRESFIGLNAFNIVKNAVCPVLTVPPEKKWETFKKILFPVRPVLAALEKYDFIRKIIWKNNATLKVLGLAANYEKDIALVKELTGQLNEKLKEDNVEGSTYFKVGKNMAEEVIKIATLMETELIVITATIESSLKQYFVSPYLQYIINHAHFPVLCIKPVLDNPNKREVLQHIRESNSLEITLNNQY